MHSLIFSSLIAATICLAICQATVIGNEAYTNYCRYSEQANPRNCLDLLCREEISSGVYTIHSSSASLYAVDVFCDQETDGGGWTVFQRRIDGWVDFYRNWNNYRLGFGDVNGEHWLGNDKLALLLSLSAKNELWIDLETVSNEEAHARYSNFTVGNRSADYTLQISGYSGTAGDALQQHNGRKFSTFDRDSDGKADRNCAMDSHGAWWYSTCHSSNLNGNYHNGVHKTYADGVNWYPWKGFFESLKTTEMKFRPQLL